MLHWNPSKLCKKLGKSDGAGWFNLEGPSLVGNDVPGRHRYCHWEYYNVQKQVRTVPTFSFFKRIYSVLVGVHGIPMRSIDLEKHRAMPLGVNFSFPLGPDVSKVETLEDPYFQKVDPI